jgi:hypothetical protein
MEKLSPDETAIIQKWNLFITMLLDCEKTWNELSGLRQEVRIDTDKLPAKAGKFFGLATSRSNFVTATGRLLDYARKYSSLEEMIVKLEIPAAPEREEKQHGRRIR